MNLYLISFKDGSKMEEYGDNVQDVAQFLERSYPHKKDIVSIELSVFVEL